jgi:hypothetical protein
MWRLTSLSYRKMAPDKAQSSDDCGIPSVPRALGFPLATPLIQAGLRTIGENDIMRVLQHALMLILAGCGASPNGTDTESPNVYSRQLSGAEVSVSRASFPFTPSALQLAARPGGECADDVPRVALYLAETEIIRRGEKHSLSLNLEGSLPSAFRARLSQPTDGGTTGYDFRTGTVTSEPRPMPNSFTLHSNMFHIDFAITREAQCVAEGYDASSGAPPPAAAPGPCGGSQPELKDVSLVVKALPKRVGDKAQIQIQVSFKDGRGIEIQISGVAREEAPGCLRHL